VSPEKQALAVFWSHKRFWLLQTLAIAAWTALALAWFWLPDSRVWGVALSALQGVVVIAGGLWLIGTTLVFYQRAHAGEDPSLGQISREGLRRVPALAVWIAVFALVIWGSPAWRRMLVAILLLQMAVPGRALGPRAKLFLDTTVLACAGVYLPYKLIAWHPQLAGLAMQTASLAVRIAAAYLLAVGAWLILASLIANSRPA